MSNVYTQDANVRLTADTSQYVQNMSAAARVTQPVVQGITAISSAYDNLVRKTQGGLTLFRREANAQITGMVASAAALETQLSSLQGVAASAGRNLGLQSIQKDIDNIRRSMPVSTGQVIGLAQNAQKMGVGSSQVGPVTQTSLKMGAATGEDAGALMSGLLGVQRAMGQSVKGTNDLADTVTALSSKLGTSAQGVLGFSEAIAPIASTIGMTTKEVLGFSAAFTRAGQDTGAAATVFTRLSQQISIAQRYGVGQRDLADAAGMNQGDFQKLDQARQIQAIFGNLGKGGADALNILDRLGLDGPRSVKAIQAVSQSGSMAQAFGIAGANNAGTTERGYEAASRGLNDSLEKLRNNVSSAAQEFGGKFTGAAARGVDALTALVSAVHDVTSPFMSLAALISGPVLLGLTAITKLLGAGGPLAAVAAVLAVRKGATATGMALAGAADADGAVDLKNVPRYLRRNAGDYLAGNLSPETTRAVARGVGLRGGDVLPTTATEAQRVRAEQGIAQGGALRHPFGGTWQSAFARQKVQGDEAPATGDRLTDLYGQGKDRAADLSAGHRWFNRGRGAVSTVAFVGPQSTIQALKMGYKPLAEQDRSIFSTLTKQTAIDALAGSDLGKGAGRRTLGSHVSSSFGVLGEAWREITSKRGPKPRTADVALQGDEMAKTLAKTNVNFQETQKAAADLTAGLKVAGRTARESATGGVKVAAGPAITEAAQDAMRPSMLRSAAGTVGHAGVRMLQGMGSLAMANLPMLGLTALTSAGSYLLNKNKEIGQSRQEMVEKVNTGDLENPLAAYSSAITKAGNVAMSFADRLQQAYDKLPAPKTVADAAKIDDAEWDIAGQLGAKMDNAALSPGEKNKMTPAYAEQIWATAVKSGASPTDLQSLQKDLLIGLQQADVSREDAMTLFDAGSTGRSTSNVSLMVDGMEDQKAAAQQAVAVARQNANMLDPEQRKKYLAQQIANVQQSQMKGVGRSTLMGGLAALYGVDAGDLQKAVEADAAGKSGLHGKWTTNIEKAAPGLLDAVRAASTGTSLYGQRTVDRSTQDFLLSTDAGRIAYQHINADGVPQSRFGLSSLAASRMGGYAPMDDQASRHLTGQSINAAVQAGGQNADLNATAAARWTDELVKTTGSQTAARQSLIELANDTRNTSDAMRQVANAAAAFATKQQQASEARQGLDQLPGYGAKTSTDALNDALTAYKANPTVEGNRAALESAMWDTESASSAAGNQLRGYVLQERQRARGVGWSQEDYDLQTGRTKRDRSRQWGQADEDFARQQSRAAEDKGRQDKYTLFDFNKQRSRGEYEFYLQRDRAQYQYDLSNARSLRDFNKQRARGDEDFNRQNQYALVDYNKQRARGDEDYNRQRKYALEDWNKQIKRAAEEQAKSMFDVQNRLQSKSTWSASGMISNIQDKVAHYKKQLENLQKLREMGISSDTIKQLGLNDPVNAQQVDRLLQDLQNDRSQVGELNNLSSQMVSIGMSFYTDKDNSAYKNALDDFNEQQKRAEEAYKLGNQRMADDFKEQQRRAAESYSISTKRMTDDYKQSMADRAADFKLSQDQQLDDHKRMLKQSEEDFKESMRRNDEQYNISLARQTTDFNLARQRQLAEAVIADADREKDFKTSLDRQRKQANDQFDILTGDITTLHAEILGISDSKTRTFLDGLYGTVTKGFDTARTAAGQLKTELSQIDIALTNTFGENWAAISAAAGPQQHLAAGRGGSGGTTAYADGGVVLPGYSPGVDNHVFTSPTAGRLLLSGGEAIMRPEWTKAVGGEAAVKKMNADAKYGRYQAFADGGVVDLTAKVNTALQFAASKIGMPYQWGGSGNPSYDCSGLTQAAYAKAGLPALPHLSASQGRMGKRVTSPQPGDLVLWDNSPRNVGADHVALYAGSGQIIEAVQPKIRRHALWGNHWFQRLIGDGVGIGNLNFSGQGGDPGIYTASKQFFDDLRAQIKAIGQTMSSAPVLSKVADQMTAYLTDRVNYFQDRTPTALAAGTIFKRKSYMVGEAGNEMLLPLNQRGSEFLADTMVKMNAVPSLPTRGAETVRAQEVANAQTINQHYDSSINFTGDVTVQAQDPNSMARMLESKARMKRLSTL